MSHILPAPHAKSRSARLVRRAALQAGVVFSLSLAILAVVFSLGIGRAAAAGLDMPAGLDDGRLTIGAVLIALFAGLCVLTTFMLRDTFDAGERTEKVRPRSRLG